MQSTAPAPYEFEYVGGWDNKYNFETSNQIGYNEKHDLPTVSAGPERYFASIFFRRDNPNRLTIVDAFERFATDDK